MKSKADPEFWRCLNALPLEVQELAEESYQLWLKEPFYPSLRFKKFKGNLWSVRIGAHYRATGYFTSPGIFVWNWIGTHEEYNKL